MAIVMTKKECFLAIEDLLENRTDETSLMLMQFCRHEVELLNAKSAKARDRQTEDQALFDLTVYEALQEAGKPVTVSELQSLCPSLSNSAGISNQKLSACMRRLGASGFVKKTVEKKKSYFSAVE